MKMKAVISSLICAALLLTVAPSKALAQTLGQPARGEQASDAGAARPKRDLKARFAAEIAKAGADTVSAEGMARLEKERLRVQSTSKVKSGFSNKEVVLAVVIVVAIVGLAIVLAHNGVDPKPSCDDEPLTPGCIR
ncbi:MAG TPA: hypothetical protein VM864_12720 [Pyrinomonadaceae bacterium]|nr:hypothetical protein [Pyrinomonadaceae bacterium]